MNWENGSFSVTVKVRSSTTLRPLSSLEVGFLSLPGASSSEPSIFEKNGMPSAALSWLAPQFQARTKDWASTFSPLWKVRPSLTLMVQVFESVVLMDSAAASFGSLVLLS